MEVRKSLNSQIQINGRCCCDDLLTCKGYLNTSVKRFFCETDSVSIVIIGQCPDRQIVQSKIVNHILISQFNISLIVCNGSKEYSHILISTDIKNNFSLHFLSRGLICYLFFA